MLPIRNERLSPIALACILICVAIPASVAVWRLLQFDTAAGELLPSPPRWPAESWIKRSPEHAVLLVFAHPQCSCTRATLSELDMLLEKSQTHPAASRPAVHVLLFRPDGGEPWRARGLWDQAAAIPGASVSWDEQGHEAKLFHVKTSGLVLLYSSAGVLQFEGGITGSRGHVGSNAAEDRLELALASTSRPAGKSLVFGCSLFGRDE